ncbi:hypothetical protein [Paracoccus aminophilus]|uniref:hypothetical protein n=1 Tax=Paracoccus aminophilus TaxID=34003 RepID=UPI0011DD5092|nr:hypothetical protein [Paracoccus aminophilus]
MRFWPIAVIIFLTGCLDEDLADRFLADESLRSLSPLAAESRIFFCAVAVYSTSPLSDPPELTGNFEPWSTIPLSERVHAEAIEMRAISNECWDEDIQRATEAADPWEYLDAAKPTNSFDHAGNVALFDPKRNIFIAISG